MSVPASRRALGTILLGFTVVVPTYAQVGARVPAFGPVSAVSAEWLQLGTGALGRDAAPSLAIAVAHDHWGHRFELGYLRAARASATAKGVTVGVSPALRLNRVTVWPGVAALIGRAVSSVDRGGYDWKTVPPSADSTGYQPRLRYMSGTTIGGSVGVAAEVRLMRALSATASVRQWLFSGSAIRGHRTPLLAGFGLSAYPGALFSSVHHSTPETTK